MHFIFWLACVSIPSLFRNLAAHKLESKKRRLSCSRPSLRAATKRKKATIVAIPTGTLAPKFHQNTVSLNLCRMDIGTVLDVGNLGPRFTELISFRDKTDSGLVNKLTTIG